jgi:hypothetical protein
MPWIPHLLVSCLALAQPTTADMDVARAARLVEVRRIWDRAPHNAFTDLIRFRDRWFCTFREGRSHVSPDGAIRVITSRDGRDWTSAAHRVSTKGDLRDPKLGVTPDGRLMLNAVESLNPPGAVRHQSIVWFSGDGETWDGGHEVGEPDFWLWRVAWHKELAYSVGYGTAGQKLVKLYQGRDGVAFQPLVEHLFDAGYPNEAALVFRNDDTGFCLLRRDEGTRTGQLGTSRPPYTTWSWHDLGVRIGGPQMIQLPEPDSRLVAGVRLYDGQVRTALVWIDPTAGMLHEFLALPSGGDTSYPGLVWHDGLLWVSYYASHEGKTSIYLAKVQLPARSKS